MTTFARCLRGYLSFSHARTPVSGGCAIPALGAEIARVVTQTDRRVLEQSLLQLQMCWAKRLDHDSDGAWSALAQCVGALMLARVVESDEGNKRDPGGGAPFYRPPIRCVAQAASQRTPRGTRIQSQEIKPTKNNQETPMAVRKTPMKVIGYRQNRGVALVIGAGDATGGAIARRFASGWLHRLHDTSQC